MKNNNKNSDPKNGDNASAGEVLPSDKKHLKKNMPDHLKSPLHNLGDKSESLPKKDNI